MIQDIEPKKFNNEFKIRKPEDEDYIFIFKDNKIILNDNNSFFKYKDIKNEISEDSQLVYIFSIDNEKYFLLLNCQNIEYFENKYGLQSNQIVRTLLPKERAFAGATAIHLFGWYSENKFCGKCGKPMEHKKDERAMICPDCGNVKYPKICPAIIVGIIDKDKILMSRYARGPYRKYSLIAGFNEIGETLEDTVKREVMEEVGLKVKNIRYYKNQPWGITSGLLVGFFAELDGDNTIKRDEDELAEAGWFKRDEIPINNSQLSLTNEMIELFRNNNL